MDFLLKTLESEDKETFAWISREEAIPTPPVTAHINGMFYRLSNFSSADKKCLVCNVASYKEALELSIKLYKGKITLPELGRIYRICSGFGILPESLEVFKAHGIKGDRSFNTLSKLSAFPETLLKYMEGKDVPLKTAGLLASLKENGLAFSASYVEKVNPSLQNFKGFVENLADFRDMPLPCVYSGTFPFPERKSPERLEIENALEKITEKAAPLKIYSTDNFETGKICFLLEASGFESFERGLKKLENLAAEIEDFFIILDKYDLR